MIDEVCPICRKAFGSRGQCLGHIEKQKPRICLVDLMLSHPDLDSEVVEEADLRQASLAAKALKQGEWHGWTGTLVPQRPGPLKRFLIPNGHSRKNRFQFFQDYLKDRTAAVEADFDDIQENMYSDLETAKDNIPLTWRSGNL